MNKQEAFDKALFGLRGQTHRSQIDGCCQYVSVYGKCAVGHIFNDSQLDTLKGMKIMGSHVAQLQEMVRKGELPNSFRFLIEIGDYFLSLLQYAHDGYFPDIYSGMPDTDEYKALMTMWEEKMEILAARYGLTYTPNVVSSQHR